MRALLPREHGLWCWVAVPLLGAALLAPGWVTVLGAVAILSLFGAGNAARRGAWGVGARAATVGMLFGLGVLPLLAAPGVWLATLGALVVGGAVGIGVSAGSTGRKVPGATALELAAIGGFAAAGAGLAVADDVPLATATIVALSLATWQVIGLWWVRGQLARVLPGRTPWAAGPVVIAGLALLVVLAAAGLGHPALAALPALYWFRITMTRPASGPRDARRIGLGEAVWAAAATVMAVGVLA